MAAQADLEEAQRLLIDDFTDFIETENLELVKILESLAGVMELGVVQVAPNDVQLLQLNRKLSLVEIDWKVGHLVVRDHMLQPQALQVDMVDPGELVDKVRGVVLAIDEVQTPHIIPVAAVLVGL
jgi:hypothetical protein